MSKTAVMLKGGWPGSFRRTIRDEEGQPVKDDTGAERVLEFGKGQIRELSADELEAVRDDIGKSLVIAKVEKDDKPVPKPDSDATRKFVEDTRKRKEAEAKERAAAEKAERQRAAAEAQRAAAKPPKPATLAPASARGDLEHKTK